MAPEIRLVLVAPRTPGNIGACARLAANFDIDDWVIVNPQCSWNDWDAKKLATGTAIKKLESIRVADTVAEAVADCHAAIAFSRKVEKNQNPTLELDDAREATRDFGRIALVFGNEETGLSREEVEPCTHLCGIATSEEHSSLNLSHAVGIALSRFYERGSRPSRGPAPAKLSEFEGMMGHWRDFLIDAGMDRGGNPERILVTLRALFERASVSAREIRALRGVLSKTQVRLGTRRRGKRVTGKSDAGDTSS